MTRPSTRRPAALIIGNASCPDCQEITRTQRFCAECNKPTMPVMMAAPKGSVSAEVYGAEKLQFWLCRPCGGLAWDGGRFYGFACLEHGGHEREEHPKTKVIPEGGVPRGPDPDVMGDDEGPFPLPSPEPMAFDRAIVFRRLWLYAVNHYARGLAEQCDELIGFWERLGDTLGKDATRLLELSPDSWPPTLMSTMGPTYARIHGFTLKWRRIVARFDIAHARCEDMDPRRKN